VQRMKGMDPGEELGSELELELLLVRVVVVVVVIIPTQLGRSLSGRLLRSLSVRSRLSSDVIFALLSLENKKN